MAMLQQSLSPSVQQSILMYLVDPEFYPVALSELQNIYGDPNMIAQMTICPKAKFLANHFGVKFTRDNIRKTSHEYSKMSEMSDIFCCNGADKFGQEDAAWRIQPVTWRMDGY